MTGKFQPQIPTGLLEQEEFQIYDYPSEIGMLACLLKTPSMMANVERQITSEQLYLGTNRVAYEVMVYMYNAAIRNSTPLSYNRIQLLSAAGYVSSYHHSVMASNTGIEHLQTLEAVSATATPDQLIGHMQNVKRSASRVMQYRLARQTMIRACDRTQFPDERQNAVFGESQFSLIASGGDHNEDYQITQLGQAWASFIDRAMLNRSHGNAGLFNVYCPLFPFWMSLMNNGFKRRGMTIVAARPKVGKSTLLLSIAIVQSLMGIPTLYMDSEMSREEMFSRALSNISMVLEHHLIRGRFMDDEVEYNALQQWLPHLVNAPLYYVNVAGKSADHITSMMRQFRNSFVGTQELIAPHNGQKYVFSNPSNVIYDWLKLPDPASSGKAAGKEHEALGYYASALKDNASSLDLPLTAGAQNNRAAIGVEGLDMETMAESFVAGSDRLAQFCTQLAILRNLSPNEEEMVRNRFPLREGRTGSNAIHFNQLLHIVFQRGGSDFRLGIPLHLDRGWARYTEMADDATFEFMRENFRRRPGVRQANGNAAGALPSTNAMQQATALAQNRGAV